MIWKLDTIQFEALMTQNAVFIEKKARFLGLEIFSTTENLLRTILGKAQIYFSASLEVFDSQESAKKSCLFSDSQSGHYSIFCAVLEKPQIQFRASSVVFDS